MSIDAEALLMLPQCNDPRVDRAWVEYCLYAYDHEPLRYLRQCGRCDSFALGVRWADKDQTEVGLVCLDCKYAIVWPVDRAYWMWKTFVQPQRKMLDHRIENGKIVYFEIDRPDRFMP